MTEQKELIHLRQVKSLLQEQVGMQKKLIAQQQEQIRLLVEENSLQHQRITQLSGQVSQLTEQVKTLQERLAKDSHNSSLPPSSDRFSRQSKPSSLRQKSEKKAGGQQGHGGTTLSMSEVADEVVRLPVTQCQQCQADLSAIAAHTIQRRQVVDVPRPRLQVSEFQGEWKQCPHCQHIPPAAFPAGVSAP